MRFRSMRWPCRYPVTVRSEQGAATATVLNVSETGLRLSGLEMPIGTVVVMQFAGERVEGRVVGHRQGQTAVAVPARLGKRQIDILREARGAGHHRLASHRPAFTELR